MEADAAFWARMDAAEAKLWPALDARIGHVAALMDRETEARGPTDLIASALTLVVIELFRRRAGAATRPAAEWTAESPTVPGWYFWRASAGAELVPVRVETPGGPVVDRFYLCAGMKLDVLQAGEWWRMPVQPPGA